MDLRGIANFGSVQYIAGGMEGGQNVSNKTFKLFDMHLLVGAIDIQKPEFSMSLFPNPSEEVLNIKISGREFCDPFELMVYDINGKLILHKKMVDCLEALDVSDLAIGVYQVKISIMEKYLSGKFVKSR